MDDGIDNSNKWYQPNSSIFRYVAYGTQKALAHIDRKQTLRCLYPSR